MRFSSLKELRKIFRVTFDIDSEGQLLLESNDLRQLSLVRNLVAHRNGIVDDAFRKATGCTQNAGDELTISEAEAKGFMSTVETVGSYLLGVAEQTMVRDRT